MAWRVLPDRTDLLASVTIPVAGASPAGTMERMRRTDTAPMFSVLRFLWSATRGHRLRPWRSPYLRWRMETFTGRKMETIDFRAFWEFTWRERGRLRHFLAWTAEMDRLRREDRTRG